MQIYRALSLAFEKPTHLLGEGTTCRCCGVILKILEKNTGRTNAHFVSLCVLVVNWDVFLFRMGVHQRKYFRYIFNEVYRYTYADLHHGGHPQ